MTFAEYMDEMLYGPVGYYSSGVAKSGKSGDYFTAPDVGEAFGVLLAEIFQDWRKRLGGSDFQLIEVGAGEGRLAQDILTRHPFRYVAVERSPVRRSFLTKIQKGHGALEVEANLDALTNVSGVIFGNELIDAFPVHRVRNHKGKLQELYVEGPGERRRFVWKDPSTPALDAYFKRIGIQLPDGYETEVNLAMTDWLDTASRVLDKGLLVLIDYGRPAHDYYAPERTRGTLRAFSQHKVSADFLDPARLVDMTADVDFTSLALDAESVGFSPLAFMEMGTFLMQGAERLTTVPKGLKYLIHPEGMGAAFHVLILGKNVRTEDWVFEHNRIGRLALPS